VLSSELHGIRPPSALPQVVWRAGVDLNPIDPRDPDARAWLENLVWPGEDERLGRLRAALDIVAADPVPIVKGDLLDELPAMVEQAPAGATVVVFHSAVITYLDDADRQRFRDLVSHYPAARSATRARPSSPTWPLPPEPAAMRIGDAPKGTPSKPHSTRVIESS